MKYLTIDTTAVMAELETRDAFIEPRLESMVDTVNDSMEDCYADEVNDLRADESQLVSVEVDTQATDGYDAVSPRDEASKLTSGIEDVVSVGSNSLSRYKVPVDQEEPIVNFKFGKAAYKAPVLRQSLPNVEAEVTASCKDLGQASEISSNAQEESHPNNMTHFSTNNGGNALISEAITRNAASVPAVEETHARQRLALKQKDSNIQRPTNVSVSSQQKHGISFTDGLVNYNQQPPHSLKNVQRPRNPTAISPPFQDIQSQMKRRRSLRPPRIPQPYASQPLLQNCMPSMLSEPITQPSTVVQPNPTHAAAYKQASLRKAELRQKEEVPRRIDVENQLNRDDCQMSSPGLGGDLQPGPNIRSQPPFHNHSEIREYSPIAANSTGLMQSSHNQTVLNSNQYDRAGTTSNDNERAGTLLSAGNLPFPRVICSSSLLNHDQSELETNQGLLGGKLKNNLDLEAMNPCVNPALQNNDPLMSNSCHKLGSLKNSGGRRGHTAHPQVTASSAVIADSSSEQLFHELQSRVEVEKLALSKQIQEQMAKIRDLSKQNGDYGTRIEELTRANCSLIAHNTKINGTANALDNRVKVLLEDHQSLKDFVMKNKSITEKCKQDVTDMENACNDASNKLETIQSYHGRVKGELIEATVLIHSQNESLSLLRQELDKCVTELQQERHKAGNLQSELERRHDNETFKNSMKSLLDNHHENVIARLATQETKLSEAINDTDRENQQRLFDCLKLLESMGEKDPQAPKEIVELVGLIESLSTSISERLQSADDGCESLRSTGAEVMETLKSRVESLLEIQDVKKELDEQISSLKVANARLEVAARGHEEKISELQAQLNDKQSELDKCRSELNLKSDSLWNQLDDKQMEIDKLREELSRKSNEIQQKLYASAASQNELTALQAVHTKTTDELSDSLKDLKTCQTILKEQSQTVLLVQDEKKDLEAQLSSAEQRIVDVEHELSRCKANANDRLKRQQMEMETDKRKCLEAEKRGHVQKASNLQRLRADAEKMVAELKIESRKMEELVESKDQVISALRAEKSTLESQNSKHIAMVAQLEESLKSQAVAYHSLIQGKKSTSSEISQLEAKLKGYDEMWSTNSDIANKIHETVQEIIRRETATASRLNSYEKVEVKVREYFQKLGIPLGDGTIDGILDQLAAFKTPQAIDYKSQSTSVDDELPWSLNRGFDRGTTVSDVLDISPANTFREAAPLECHQYHSKSKEFIEPAIRVQVPKSPEVLDSQVRFNLSPSPMQRRDVRRIAPQRCSTLSSPQPYMRGSYEEVTKITTKFTRIRESTNHQSPEEAHCCPHQTSHTEFPGSIVGDSQNGESNLVSAASDSSLTDIDPVFDHPDEGHLQVLNRQRNKKGLRKDTLNQSDPNALHQKTSRKSGLAQSIKPLKSCLKQAKNNTADWQAVSNIPANPALLKPQSTNQSAKQHSSILRLAALTSAGNPSKLSPSNNNLNSSESSPGSVTKQSISSSQFESTTSQRSLRKRSISSVPSGPKSEPPTKQARLSIPGRNFQAVPPFFSNTS